MNLVKRGHYDFALSPVLILLTSLRHGFRLPRMSQAPPPITVRFQLAAPGMPKHARLRHAIIDAVEAGELPAGTMVMGELAPGEALGLSLGTAQKALSRLREEGFLVRRQCHGTFVGSVRRPIARSWHSRFVAPGGEELSVFATLLERRLVSEDGPWSAALGPDPKGYVMIRRILDIGGKFNCTTAMYLGASRFSRLLRIAERRLTDTNLKAMLSGEFSAPTLHSEGIGNVVEFVSEDAALMGLPARSVGLQIHITGRSLGRMPITFLQMSVSPTLYGLKIDFNRPGSQPASGQ